MEGLLLIIVGAFALYYPIRFIKDPLFADNYINKSPKAFIWRKIFGVEKAKKITKMVFAPIGIILGLVLIINGIASLF